MYTNIYVEHSIPMQDMKENMHWIFKPNKMNIIVKSLQIESISQMGWLLYSFGSLNL